MKILVTGVAGFIGSFTARKLLENGYDVIGIDNFDNFYSREVKELNVELIKFDAGQKDVKDLEICELLLNKFSEYQVNNREGRVGSFKFEEMDILDKDKINELINNNKFDGIVHLAAMAGVPHSIKEPIKYSKVNIEGTVNILEVMAKNSITNFVFASSSSVYGNCLDIPFKENINVDNPISQYAATKRMNEIMNYTYHYLYGINVCNLRFFTVYGPLQRPYGMAIQKFIKQAYHNKPITIYGDGSMSRDYTYIDDITEGILLALKNNKGFNTYNLGNKSTVNLKNLTELIIKNMGKGSVISVETPKTEVAVTYADISKSNSELGYNPLVSIEEGIRRQVEIFNLMPEWYKELTED